MQEMMIENIRSHNKLNGVMFSIVEFTFIALVIAPFAAYYLLHAQPLMAAISVGILLNCLVIVAFGVRSWLSGGPNGRTVGMMAAWRSKTERARLAVEHPRMLRDTIILVATLLLPFVLLVLTLYELIAARVRGHRSRV